MDSIFVINAEIEPLDKKNKRKVALINRCPHAN